MGRAYRLSLHPPALRHRIAIAIHHLETNSHISLHQPMNILQDSRTFPLPLPRIEKYPLHRPPPPALPAHSLITCIIQHIVPNALDTPPPLGHRLGSEGSWWASGVHQPPHTHDPMGEASHRRRQYTAAGDNHPRGSSPGGREPDGPAPRQSDRRQGDAVPDNQRARRHA